MTEAQVQIIPRILDESARAHEAKIAYVTMGPQRSLEKLRQRLGKESAGYVRTLEAWSSRYDWQATARAWDDQQAAALSADASAKYRADLEKHRTEASDAGAALYTVSGQLIKAINAALAGPRKIEGKDGKIYTIHSIEMNASTFSIAARAMSVALDLRAHSLGVDRILASLEGEDEE